MPVEFWKRVAMRTDREFLVVLALSLFAALAYPAAAAQPSVPAGPNLCEDMETHIACLFWFLCLFLVQVMVD